MIPLIPNKNYKCTLSIFYFAQKNNILNQTLHYEVLHIMLNTYLIPNSRNKNLCSLWFDEHNQVTKFFSL